MVETQVEANSSQSEAPFDARSVLSTTRICYSTAKYPAPVLSKVCGLGAKILLKPMIRQLEHISRVITSTSKDLTSSSEGAAAVLLLHYHPIGGLGGPAQHLLPKPAGLMQSLLPLRNLCNLTVVLATASERL